MQRRSVNPDHARLHTSLRLIVCANTKRTFFFFFLCFRPHFASQPNAFLQPIFSLPNRLALDVLMSVSQCKAEKKMIEKPLMRRLFGLLDVHLLLVTFIFYLNDTVVFFLFLRRCLMAYTVGVTLDHTATSTTINQS